MTTDSSWDKLNREFATSIVAKLRQEDFTAYFAGGCVRDQLMGLCPKDYDVATNASPEQIAEIFGSRNTHLVGAAFGVACVHKKIQGRAFQVEVATFRTDGEYVDGRRPTSVRYASPEDDAQRRDFTINGMFYDPIALKLHDFVGGGEDLERRLVRAIGSPQQRFAEDKLRMVRAVRFAAKFNFAIEEETKLALVRDAESLAQISNERLADELSKMAQLENCRKALNQLHDFGLLQTIWPQLATFWTDLPSSKTQNLRLVGQLQPSQLELVVACCIWVMCTNDAALSVRVIADDVAKWLKLSNELAAAIEYLAENVDFVLNAEKHTWSKLQPLAINPKVGELIKLAYAISMSEQIDDGGVRSFEDRIRQHAGTLNPEPIITGNDLIHAGYRPGAEFKSILQVVRDQQLNGNFATKEDAMKFVKSSYPKSN